MLQHMPDIHDTWAVACISLLSSAMLSLHMLKDLDSSGFA